MSMSREDKKEYLKKYRNAKEKMEMGEDMAKYYLDLQKRLEGGWLKPPNRDVAGYQRYADLLDRVKKFRKKISLGCKNSKKISEEIKNVVLSIHDDQEADVLRMRYLEGKTVEEIADTMSYCCASIGRIHKRALDNLDL